MSSKQVTPMTIERDGKLDARRAESKIPLNILYLYLFHYRHSSFVSFSLSLARCLLFVLFFFYTVGFCRISFFINNIADAQLISSSNTKHQRQRENELGVFIASTSSIQHFSCSSSPLFLLLVFERRDAKRH